MNAQQQAAFAKALRAAGFSASEVAEALAAAEGRTKVAEEVKPITHKPRRTRAQRIAEANPLIRPQRAAKGKTCACGRSMSKARTGTKVNGKVVCHFCWTHR